MGLGKFGDNRFVLAFQSLHGNTLWVSTNVSISHPVHPSTVHFPIAFLTGANVMNLVYGVATYFPALSPFEVDTPNTGMLSIAGYFLNVIGLITAVPALLTGFAELYAMVQSRGLFVTDQNTGEQRLEPVVKRTLIHVRILQLS